MVKRLATLPCPEASVKPDIYDYKPVGEVLSFGIANRLDLLAGDFASLLKKKGVSSKEVYFYSKDKIYVELYNNKNLLPENYNPFLNFPAVPDPVIFDQARRDGVSFIVMDSTRNLSQSISFLEFAQATSLGYPQEVMAHLALLRQIQAFSGSARLAKVDCDTRWCLYRIKSN